MRQSYGQPRLFVGSSLVLRCKLAVMPRGLKSPPAMPESLKSGVRFRGIFCRLPPCATLPWEKRLPLTPTHIMYIMTCFS